MRYQDYIQQVDAAWMEAQRQGQAGETQILAAILFRLVQPPEAAVRYLNELAAQTSDPAIRSRYEQAIEDIEQCEEEVPNTNTLAERRELSAIQFADVLSALRQSCYLNGRVPHISVEEMDSYGVQAVRLSTDRDDIRLEFPLLEEGRELVRSVYPSSRGEESENES